MAGVRPEPPAAFSALATTRSRLYLATRPLMERQTMSRPGLPTMSPMKRKLTVVYSGWRKKLKRKRIGSDCGWKSDESLLCGFGEAAFADHGYFDFAWVSQLLLESFGDFAADFGGRFVGGCAGARDDADFAASLDRECLF